MNNQVLPFPATPQPAEVFYAGRVPSVASLTDRVAALEHALREAANWLGDFANGDVEDAVNSAAGLEWRLGKLLGEDR